MKKGFFHLRHEFFLKDSNSKLKNCAGIIKESTNISVKNFTDKYFSYLKIVLVFRIKIHKFTKCKVTIFHIQIFSHLLI